MKNLLFTGSSGFLGKNILALLQKQYNVSTLDLRDADYLCNLSKGHCELNKTFDIVLHAAGKAHSIPTTEVEKQVFYDVNYQGTVNLCRSLEKTGIPQSFIFISTVAVYGCKTGYNITEEHPLNGNSPYALSKMKAEEYLKDWSKKHQVILSIIRPSLIAGLNPPGNLGAMIKGIKSGFYFNISGGVAKKSVLMVQDIANLVPLLVEKGGIYNVCDDTHPSFGELSTLIAKQLNTKNPISIPYWTANIMALFGNLLGGKAPIDMNRLAKIIQPLTFSNAKAKESLAWQPLNVLENFKIFE
ncbi:UDP-galactose-4-epimerase [Bacteroidia bacterium]|nr:UDP-galactose-4-epimerase [Bacteroidia bacterium]